MFCGSGGSRSRLAKAAGAETLGEKGGIKNCTRLWREADLKVKMFKAPRSQSTCWRWEIEKLHPVVARSTFGSQNAQIHKLRSMFRRWDVQDVDGLVAQSRFWSQHVKNLSCSEHFWKLSCSKGARGCGAKDIRSQNAIKCVNQSDLFALLFDVWASCLVADAMDSAPCQKWAKREGCVAVAKDRFC